jgi:hypothetical protein
MSGNPTLTNLANESLRTISSSLLSLLQDPSVPAASIGSAVTVFRTTRAAAHKMLIDASYSNKGYEEQDFSRDTAEALSAADRLLDVAGVYGGVLDGPQ